MHMVEDGCVEALISLPASLFRGTGAPAMIWLLTPSGTQRKEILFIDASSAGRMVNRTLRRLDDFEIQKIVQIVEDWRAGRPTAENDGSIRSGSVAVQKIRDLDYDLNPANFLRRPYVAPRVEDALPNVYEIALNLNAAHAISEDRHFAVTQLVQDLDGLNELISSASANRPTSQLSDLCQLVPGTPTHDAPDGSVPVLKPKNLALGRLGPMRARGTTEYKRPGEGSQGDAKAKALRLFHAASSHPGHVLPGVIGDGNQQRVCAYHCPSGASLQIHDPGAVCGRCGSPTAGLHRTNRGDGAVGAAPERSQRSATPVDLSRYRRGGSPRTCLAGR